MRLLNLRVSTSERRFLHTLGPAVNDRLRLAGGVGIVGQPEVRRTWFRPYARPSTVRTAPEVVLPDHEVMGRFVDFDLPMAGRGSVSDHAASFHSTGVGLCARVDPREADARELVAGDIATLDQVVAVTSANNDPVPTVT